MKIKPFSTKEIINWLNPYPITINKNKKWVLGIYDLNKVLEWNNPNKLPNLGRISFNNIADLIIKNGSVAGLQDHYIKTMARDWATIADTLTVIATKRGKQTIVWDGSHRLTALALAKRLKFNIKLKYIGVLMPYENKRKKI